MKTSKVVFILIPIMSFFLLSFSADISDPILLYSGKSCDLPGLIGDEFTGTTHAIWSTTTESDPPSPKVFISSLTPTVDGQMKKGKIRKLATPGYEATGVHNSIDNTYLVVWSGFTEPLQQVFNPVRSRLLDASGKFLGGTINYPDKNVGNISPLSIHNPETNRYLLIWYRGYSDFTEGPAGTNTVMLDNYGELVSAEKNIKPPLFHDNVTWITRAWSGQYNRQSKRFLIMVSERGFLNSVWSGLVFLYRLDEKGNLIRRVRLNSSILDYNFTGLVSSSISEQNDSNKSSHVIAWSEPNYLLIRKINKLGKFAGPKKKYLSSTEKCYPSISYSPYLNEYWVSYKDKSGLLVRKVNASGSDLGNPIVISKSENIYSSCIKWNPYIGKFILIWIERYLGSPDKVWLTTIS